MKNYLETKNVILYLIIYKICIQKQLFFQRNNEGKTFFLQNTTNFISFSSLLFYAARILFMPKLYHDSKYKQYRAIVNARMRIC